MNKKDQDYYDIRTEAKPCCPICGHKGMILYRNQHDRLFGTRGKWNLRKCLAEDCGLLWGDPMPVVSDIPKLYQKYYTHQNVHDYLLNNIGIKNVYCRAKLGYLSRKYHYEPNGSVSGFDRFLSLIFYMLPNRRADLDHPFRWLSSLPKGDLLEVGCGAGGMLEKMQTWGWNVTGLEPDEKALAMARNKGFDVRCDDLVKCKFDEESFDAIIMHHVFEHIENPIKILEECRRILRRNGLLLITTPNSESLGHIVFGNNWRGLEVPRHLIIYGVQSMNKLACLVGMMGRAIIFSYGRGGIDVLRQSYCLKKYNVSSHKIGLLPKFRLEIVWSLAWIMNLFSKDKRWGEELIFIYHK